MALFQHPELHKLHLLARFHLNKRTAWHLRRSISIFERLQAEAPGNGVILTGLAECQLFLAIAGIASPATAMPYAEALARKALTSDDRLSDAHVVLGNVLGLYEWNWSGAEQEFHRALELNRSDVFARNSYVFASLLPTRRFDHAIEIAREAIELDPLSLNANIMLAFALYAAGRFKEAISQCEKVIDLEPACTRAHVLDALAHVSNEQYEKAIQEIDLALDLGDRGSISLARSAACCIYAMAGQRRRALALLKTATESGKQQSLSRYWPALAYAVLGRPDQAFRLLQDAFKERDPWLVSITFDPLLGRLREDSRYTSLLIEMGLSDSLADSNATDPLGSYVVT